MPGLSSSGLTIARLKHAGTTDVANDLLIMAVINGMIQTLPQKPRRDRV